MTFVPFCFLANLFFLSVDSFLIPKTSTRNSNISILYNSAQPSINFDSDFADMISKPLPEWYKEQKEEEDRVLREEEKNRERILKEFREKYEDISEDQKVTEFDNKISRNMNKGWIESIFSSPSRAGSSSGEEKTTREKWSDLVAEEKKIGFNLPSFFEVFPELKLKWPIWSKRKDGSAIKCEKDSDCVFPQACCQHPVLPGEKFCCTGFGRRVLVPAYATIKVLADQSIPQRDSSPGGSIPRW